MTSIVLVHGGAHGAWCWDRVVPHLEADPAVESVTAVDLAGHGTRATEPHDTIRLADYVDDVVGAVEAGDLHDVVLVGHSLAGVTITAAAHRLGSRLRRLVYLSTSNPPVGQSVDELMTHPRSPLSRGVDFERMFCNDLDPATAAWLLGNLGGEPPGPMAEPAPVAVGPAGTPRTFVLLPDDEALPPDFQREQAATAEVDEIVEFDAGHSAFASRPADLAALLLDLSRQSGR